MLQVSNLYRVQLILGKAKETDMHAECAILYGKVSMDCKICELATDRLMIQMQDKEVKIRLKFLFYVHFPVFLTLY